MIRSAAVLLLLLSLAGCGGSGGGGPGAAGPVVTLPPAEVEPNDLPAQALDLGSVTSAHVTGNISSTGSEEGLPTGDVDLVRFTPAVSGTLRVTLTSPEDEDSDFDLGLLDSTGQRLATARTTRRTEVLYAIVTKDRPLLIQAGGYSGAPGPYDLRLLVKEASDPAGHPEPAPMNEARCFHGMAALMDGGAIVGGGTRSALSPESAFLGGIASTEIFDPETGKFTLGPDLGVTRFGVTATALPDGRVLFAGGDLAGTALIYDPETGAMDGEQISLSDGMRALHTATLLPCGRVLLAGGARISMTFPPKALKLNSSEIFDPKTNTFTAGPMLKSVRFSHATCLLADGRVLITGGEHQASTEIIDPRHLSAGSIAGPALTADRDDHTATLLADGRVLVTGGQQWTGGTQDTAEILDDVTAGSSSGFRLIDARMSTRRSDHVAILTPDGTVLLLGGEYDPPSGPDIVLTAVDLFDPATETFRALPDLKSGRDDHRAAVLTDGRILVTGGEDESTNAIPDVEAYSVE